MKVIHLSKRQIFDTQESMQLSRFLDRVEPHVGAVLSLHLQGSAQHAPSPDKREGLN